MLRKVVLVTLLLGLVTAKFSSSSESCEDDGGRPGGRPGGGRPGGGRPGGGNGGGNGGGGPNGGCDAGWRRFNRPSGGWCIRSFAGVINQAAADAQCRSYGATLSGIQNMDEARYAAISAIPLLGKATGSLWIGAKRKSACVGQSITATCNELNSFSWTDNSATGTAGFIWNPLQPDNSRGDQQCVIMTATRSAFTVKNAVWNTATMDDVGCVLNPADPSPRAISGYVCGKPPRR